MTKKRNRIPAIRPNPEPVCIPKALPDHLLIEAAAEARRVNPVNTPARTFMPLEPLHIALLTSKFWGPEPRTFSVSFSETAPADLKARIVEHANAWSKTTGIKFALTASGGDMRITRTGNEYSSYVGTDNRMIQASQATMHLSGFTMQTPESEYRRVIRHEVGHFLGCPHEHMRKEIIQRVDPERAYTYFARFGWTRQDVDQQVLTPLDDRDIMSTPADQTSIMCYQMPASVTKDGLPILGGPDINQSDYDFMGRVYPQPAPIQADTIQLELPVALVAGKRYRVVQVPVG